MTWIARAGETKAIDLIAGYTLHHLVPGLYGFSVQYAPGRSVDALAKAGQFPNATISYADENDLKQALGLSRAIGLHLAPREQPRQRLPSHILCAI